jgi:hypothetical protein
VFNRTVQDIKAKNAGIDLDHLQELVDEALGEVRADRHPTEKAASQTSQVLIAVGCACLGIVTVLSVFAHRWTDNLIGTNPTPTLTCASK